jgi:SpoVK/Ycf46/Vps4 family AAA+-type ATPase
LAFTEQARAFGLPEPRGLLLLGVQGGGKSLLAKAVSTMWKLPLLRLDMGRVFAELVGASEENMRMALRLAETVAPAILWIDEIEKGLASDDEGGPSKRILGTLLTWMAERTTRVFLVATANDIEMLPPELLRKGRFDEIFFVDLPDAGVREAIFRIHLNKRDQAAENFDIEQLRSASEGFSGAEIEQAVVSALYASHASDEPLDTRHFLREIEQTRPLSVLMAEKIEYLRDWASNRTVIA